jgi:hypothetical protein
MLNEGIKIEHSFSSQRFTKPAAISGAGRINTSKASFEWTRQRINVKGLDQRCVFRVFLAPGYIGATHDQSTKRAMQRL